MATYSLPSRSSNCCEDGVLKCPETTCGDCGDCDENLNKYWYEDYNWVWQTYESMFLYTVKCDPCPVITYLDPWGVTQKDCSHCDSIYTIPIELFWNSSVCGYVSADGVHVYSREHGQRTNWFGYARNGEVYIDPYGAYAYADTSFLPQSNMSSVWFDYDQGGNHFVKILPQNNLAGTENVDVRCPKSTACE